MKTSTVLKKAQGIISTPEKWCKASNFANGRHCIRGALFTVAMAEENSTLSGILLSQKVWAPAFWVLEMLTPGMEKTGLNTINFNDAPKTTHDDVMSLFDWAIGIQLAEEAENDEEGQSQG